MLWCLELCADESTCKRTAAGSFKDLNLACDDAVTRHGHTVLRKAAFTDVTLSSSLCETCVRAVLSPSGSVCIEPLSFIDSFCSVLPNSLKGRTHVCAAALWCSVSLIQAGDNYSWRVFQPCTVVTLTFFCQISLLPLSSCLALCVSVL